VTRIVFVDTETTGLERTVGAAGADEVIDLHIELWELGRREVVYSKRFFPVGTCSEGAARVNGYSPDRWHQLGALGPFTAQDAQEVAIALTKGDMLAGAQIDFDRDMLQGMFHRVRVPWPGTVTRRLVELQALAAPLLIAGRIQSVSLLSLAQYFLDPNVVQEHTARGDVDLSIRVFEAIVGTYYASAFASQGAAA
jgi:hypothetical protein